jgi:adenine-specific DNA-methyltransferase
MELDKLRMQTRDGVADNISWIAEKFPNCVTEKIDAATGEVKLAVDFDMLRQELSSEVVEGKDERYQFVWPDKKKAILLANAPINATLRPCEEESEDFANTQNLYIEGDNLDVLKCLKETYLGKVKMIYIDPPYNTGNDFVYNDDFAESVEDYLANSGQFDEQGNRLVPNLESNGRFHSDWLNMMYPRLKVARDLLTDDGVIFISIDDNEVDNLRKLCDEIFGSDNRVETIVWKNKYGAGAYTVGFISVHEYILCYSKKKISNLTSELDEEGQAVYSKRDEKYNLRGGYMTQPLMTNSLGDRPNLMYSIEYNGVTIHPRKQWVWSQERLQKAIDNNEVEFNLQKDGSYSVRSKAYLRDENGKMRRGKPLSLMSGPFNQEGTKEIRALFDGKSIFDFTKPSQLIKKFLSLQINDDDNTDFIVMDFFSGSGTTADAVMQLNSEDGGHRKFIMVQIPELIDKSTIAYKVGYRTICEIGKDRIRNAGKAIKESSPLTTQNLDTGFRVLKLDSSNMEDVYYAPSEVNQEQLKLFADNVKPDRTGKDLLFQSMLDLGATLDSKIEIIEVNGKVVYNVAEGYLVACFDKEVSDDVVMAIAQMQPQYAVLRDSSLADDSTATNFEQIFKTFSPTTTCKIL